MKRPAISDRTLSPDAFEDESVRLDTSAIGARMRAARKELGLTQDVLSQKAGSASKRGLQDNESGKTMPGGQMIGTLVRAGINANWLLTGAGPMLLKDLGNRGGAEEELDRLRQAVAELKASQGKINVGALAAIIDGALKAKPNASPERIGELCAEFYAKCIAEELITAEGIGPGRKPQAA